MAELPDSLAQENSYNAGVSNKQASQYVLIFFPVDNLGGVNL